MLRPSGEAPHQAVLTLASDVEHGTWRGLIAVPGRASRDTARQVNRSKRLAAPWIAKHQRQGVCLDVPTHQPLNWLQASVQLGPYASEDEASAATVAGA